MTIAVGDGERILALRYSSFRNSQTLYHRRNARALREVGVPVRLPAWPPAPLIANGIAGREGQKTPDGWTEKTRRMLARAHSKKAVLHERTACSVKVVAGPRSHRELTLCVPV